MGKQHVQLMEAWCQKQYINMAVNWLTIGFADGLFSDYWQTISWNSDDSLSIRNMILLNCNQNMNIFFKEITSRNVV